MRRRRTSRSHPRCRPDRERTDTAVQPDSRRGVAGGLGWVPNRHSSMGITKSSGRCWPPTARSSVWHCATMSDVTGELWWRDEDAEYIRHRSSRYPGATDLEPVWTLEAAADPRCIVLDPDPKSRTGAVRIIGFRSALASSSRSSRLGELARGSPRGRAVVRICGTTRGRDESERDARRPSMAA